MLRKPKILISGDSFAAPTDNMSSWTNLLQNEYEIVNVAQAGVSEYKILKQVQNIDVNKFDYTIVIHTSPNRVYIKEHPLHLNSVTHNNCDLIFNDIANTNKKDIIIETALNYFKYIFDEVYYKDVYQLIAQEIIKTTSPKPTLHITFFGNLHHQIIDWSNIWQTHSGKVNHLNNEGNWQVSHKVTNWINQNC